MNPKRELGETASITDRLRRNLGPVLMIDPAQWDHREKAHSKMLELNDSPTSALVRELADTLYFERHPEKRN